MRLRDIRKFLFGPSLILIPMVTRIVAFGMDSCEGLAMTGLVTSLFEIATTLRFIGTTSCIHVLHMQLGYAIQSKSMIFKPRAVRQNILILWACCHPMFRFDVL